MALLVSASALDLIETAAGARTAAEAGRALFAALQPYGARAIYARSIRTARPDDEHVYSRISPPGWEELYAERRFAEINFVAREVRRWGEPFLWSQAELQGDRERELFQVLNDLNFPDGIAAPVHGPGGYLGVTSVAFSRLDQIAPDERAAIG
ncbi:MAG TPA: autoinducer binding domain-containing protein, partial [Caulobacteraceae bacterium]|nr:autoinducer binding domain-containing protein [Caulobacteraceae bacterium]